MPRYYLPNPDMKMFKALKVPLQRVDNKSSQKKIPCPAYRSAILVFHEPRGSVLLL